MTKRRRNSPERPSRRRVKGNRLEVCFGLLKMGLTGHPIEATGKELRALFAWKQQDADYTDGSAAR